MVRISNFIVGFLNCLSLLFGLVAIAMSLFFYVHGGSQCQKALEFPLLMTGVILLVVSLLGLIGSCCKLNSLLFLYLFVMFFLMIGLLGFTVFSFMITNESVGRAFSNKGVGNLKTWDFTNWLRNHFINGNNWNEIRSCLRESDVCRTSGFYKNNLSPIQSGCCQPPSQCGLEQQSAKIWVASKEGSAVDSRDCNRWSNERHTLCYDCDSCKEGFLINIKKQWRYLAIFNLCALILVILGYICGCCAKRNNRRVNNFRKYRP